MHESFNSIVTQNFSFLSNVHNTIESYSTNVLNNYVHQSSRDMLMITYPNPLHGSDVLFSLHELLINLRRRTVNSSKHEKPELRNSNPHMTMDLKIEQGNWSKTFFKAQCEHEPAWCCF